MRTELNIPNFGVFRVLVLGDVLLSFSGVPLEDIVFEGG